MSEPYIPTLDPFAGFITNANEKAAFILRHFIYNPSDVSDFFNSDQVSLRQLASSYQGSPGILVSTVKAQLETAMANNIPEMFLDIDISYADIDDTKYKLIFSIKGSPTSIGDKKPLILSGAFLVDDEYKITINFDTKT